MTRLSLGYIWAFTACTVKATIRLLKHVMTGQVNQDPPPTSSSNVGLCIAGNLFVLTAAFTWHAKAPKIYFPEEWHSPITPELLWGGGSRFTLTHAYYRSLSQCQKTRDISEHQRESALLVLLFWSEAHVGLHWPLFFTSKKLNNDCCFFLSCRMKLYRRQTNFVSFAASPCLQYVNGPWNMDDVIA